MKRISVIIVSLISIGLSAQDLGQGLQAHWSFNGNAIDLSGNGKNGSVSGATLDQDRSGNAFSAYSFDGVDDYISFSSIALTDASYSFWINPDVMQVPNGSHMNIIESNQYYSRIFLNNGKIEMEVDVNNVHIRFTPSLITVDSWQHIVITRSGGTAKFYLNGQHIETLTGQTTDVLTVNKLGRPNDYRAFDGLIDDVRIYNRELSQSEITILSNETDGSPWKTSQLDIFYETGNVGIGTTTPDAKLTVKGDIHAEEINVDLNISGPDYVFEEDYELLSLEETENYIKTHKHLPEIPSAKEMQEKGIDLAEMNMLLLKKVEELTLHIFRMNSTIKKQEDRINQLENDLNQ